MPAGRRPTRQLLLAEPLVRAREEPVRLWPVRSVGRAVGDREVAGPAILSTVPRDGLRAPNIPFVGLSEGYALNAIRKTGVPLQRIRPALELLGKEMGLGHALASRKLFTDGAEVLFDYAQKTGGDEGEAVRELVVVRNRQRVFADVVEGYLQRIEFGADGFATAIPLTGFDKAELVADVRRSFGQPIFVTAECGYRTRCHSSKRSAVSMTSPRSTAFHETSLRTSWRS